MLPCPPDSDVCRSKRHFNCKLQCMPYSNGRLARPLTNSHTNLNSTFAWVWHLRIQVTDAWSFFIHIVIIYRWSTADEAEANNGNEVSLTNRERLLWVNTLMWAITVSHSEFARDYDAAGMLKFPYSRKRQVVATNSFCCSYFLRWIQMWLPWGPRIYPR